MGSQYLMCISWHQLGSAFQVDHASCFAQSEVSIWVVRSGHGLAIQAGLWALQFSSGWGYRIDLDQSQARFAVETPVKRKAIQRELWLRPWIKQRPKMRLGGPVDQRWFFVSCRQCKRFQANCSTGMLVDDLPTFQRMSASCRATR